MASEIKVSSRISVRNVNLEHDFSPSTLVVDQSSQVSSGGVQIIGTNAEAVIVGDVTAAGWSHFRNLAPTAGQYIDVGTGTGTSFSALARLYPGEYFPVPLHPTNPPTARASTSQTSSLNLENWIGSR